METTSAALRGAQSAISILTGTRTPVLPSGLRFRKTEVFILQAPHLGGHRPENEFREFHNKQNGCHEWSCTRGNGQMIMLFTNTTASPNNLYH
jgi:hypothetical protein